MIESSYNSLLVGHQILVRSQPTSASFKRRRFHINRCCSTYRESLTIRMSANSSADTPAEEVPIGPQTPVVPFEERQEQQQEELEEERQEAPPIQITAEAVAAVKTERRNSRDSSEGDLVHVSEFSSINNGNSPPPSGEATPISSENQKVDLKFERRGSKETIINKSYVGPKQRRDLKEPAKDDTVTVAKQPRYSLSEKFVSDEKSNKQFWTNVQCAAGIGLTAVLIGTYIYFKYR